MTDQGEGKGEEEERPRRKREGLRTQTKEVTLEFGKEHVFSQGELEVGV